MNNLYDEEPRWNESHNAYMGRMQRKKQQAEAQAKRQAEEAARNQPAPQPADEKDAILLKHAQAYEKELAERAQLTQQQRDYENLDAELSTLSAKIADLSRNYTLNKPQLEPLEKRLSEIMPQHEQLRKELTPPEPTLWLGDKYVGGKGNHE